MLQHCSECSTRNTGSNRIQNIRKDIERMKTRRPPHFRILLHLGILLIFLGLFITVSLAAEEQQQQKPLANVAATRRQLAARRDVAFCEGTASAFFVSDNVLIMPGNSSQSGGVLPVILRNVSEKACLNLCANNRDNRGRSAEISSATKIESRIDRRPQVAGSKVCGPQKPVFCGSATYDQDRKICSMYRVASEPDGELSRKNEDNNGGLRYFEKFCLAEDLPMDCGNKQFIRVDNYILRGYAQSTTMVPTLADCVAFCVREKEFECRSAMYFYEEGECITNVESAITAPDDFMKPDDDDPVVFFHNGCIKQSTRPNVMFLADSVDEDTDQLGAAGEPADRTKITREKGGSRRLKNRLGSASLGVSRELFSSAGALEQENEEDNDIDNEINTNNVLSTSSLKSKNKKGTISVEKEIKVEKGKAVMITSKESSPSTTSKASSSSSSTTTTTSPSTTTTSTTPKATTTTAATQTSSSSSLATLKTQKLALQRTTVTTKAPISTTSSTQKPSPPNASSSSSSSVSPSISTTKQQQPPTQARKVMKTAVLNRFPAMPPEDDKVEEPSRRRTSSSSSSSASSRAQEEEKEEEIESLVHRRRRPQLEPQDDEPKKSGRKMGNKDNRSIGAKDNDGDDMEETKRKNQKTHQKGALAMSFSSSSESASASSRKRDSSEEAQAKGRHQKGGGGAHHRRPHHKEAEKDSGAKEDADSRERTRKNKDKKVLKKSSDEKDEDSSRIQHRKRAEKEKVERNRKGELRVEKDADTSTEAKMLVLLKSRSKEDGYHNRRVRPLKNSKETPRRSGRIESAEKDKSSDDSEEKRRREAAEALLASRRGPDGRFLSGDQRAELRRAPRLPLKTLSMHGEDGGPSTPRRLHGIKNIAFDDDDEKQKNSRVKSVEELKAHGDDEKATALVQQERSSSSAESAEKQSKKKRVLSEENPEKGTKIKNAKERHDSSSSENESTIRGYTSRRRLLTTATTTSSPKTSTKTTTIRTTTALKKTASTSSSPSLRGRRPCSPPPSDDDDSGESSSSAEKVLEKRKKNKTAVDGKREGKNKEKLVSAENSEEKESYQKQRRQKDSTMAADIDDEAPQTAKKGIQDEQKGGKEVDATAKRNNDGGKLMHGAPSGVSILSRKNGQDKSRIKLRNIRDDQSVQQNEQTVKAKKKGKKAEESDREMASGDKSPEEQFEGVEGSFSGWGPWTPCRWPGERRIRRRKCLDLRLCRGPLMQIDYCPRNMSAATDEDEPATLWDRSHPGLKAIQIPTPEQRDQEPGPPGFQPPKMKDENRLQDNLLKEDLNGVDSEKMVIRSGLATPAPPPHRRPVAIDLTKGPDEHSEPRPIQEKSEHSEPPPTTATMSSSISDGKSLTSSGDANQKSAIKKDIVAEKEEEEDFERRRTNAPTPSLLDGLLKGGSDGPDAIWSPWTGKCQHFASTQPCQDGRVIGFEARECVAKNPRDCKGPFFRYCTIACRGDDN